MAVEQASDTHVHDVLSSLPLQASPADPKRVEFLDWVAHEKEDIQIPGSLRALRAIFWAAMSAILVGGLALWLSNGEWLRRYLLR